MKNAVLFFIFSIVFIAAGCCCQPCRSLVVVGQQETRTFQSPSRFSQVSVMFTDEAVATGKLSGFYIVQPNDTSNGVSWKFQKEFKLGKDWECKKFREVYGDFLHKKNGKIFLWKEDRLPLDRLNPFIKRKPEVEVYFQGRKGIEVAPALDFPSDP